MGASHNESNASGADVALGEGKNTLAGHHDNQLLAP